MNTIKIPSRGALVAGYAVVVLLPCVVIMLLKLLPQPVVVATMLTYAFALFPTYYLDHWLLGGIGYHSLAIFAVLEANAAMRSIVRKDSGEDWKQYLRGLARAEGLENPTDEDLRRLDRRRQELGTRRGAQRRVRPEQAEGWIEKFAPCGLHAKRPWLARPEEFSNERRQLASFCRRCAGYAVTVGARTGQDGRLVNRLVLLGAVHDRLEKHRLKTRFASCDMDNVRGANENPPQLCR